ncbi:mycothiol transferase [Jatrophihabitans lederbergiae]|uniref:mycothiol transferase n=1 Tax=Jatrophihabitans lederbergiae TaxID=3075547 RepID=UPI0037BFD41F
MHAVPWATPAARRCSRRWGVPTAGGWSGSGSRTSRGHLTSREAAGPPPHPERRRPGQRLDIRRPQHVKNSPPAATSPTTAHPRPIREGTAPWRPSQSTVNSWLTTQHERMLGIVDGLTEKQIRTAVLPSGWTPVGMLVHVREATRFWLAEILLGSPHRAVHR